VTPFIDSEPTLLRAGKAGGEDVTPGGSEGRGQQLLACPPKAASGTLRGRLLSTVRWFGVLLRLRGKLGRTGAGLREKTRILSIPGPRKISRMFSERRGGYTHRRVLQYGLFPSAAGRCGRPCPISS
jgi:hypothetical protein